ncbi:MAG: cyclic nucleotide-binding domain-containing protein [Verrucomicrobiota bacterium]
MKLQLPTNIVKAMEALFSTSPVLNSFQNIPIFAELSQDALITLYVASHERVVHAGEVIVREGEPGDEMFIVGSGVVEVMKNISEDNVSVIATLGQNEFFGEMCVIEPIVRSATVVAKETCFLYSLTSNSLNKLYQIWPDQHTIIMKNLCRCLGERITKMDETFLARAS